METEPDNTKLINPAPAQTSLGKLCPVMLSALLYLTATAVLYWPYLSSLHRFDYILPLNSLTAAAGCYILSYLYLRSHTVSFFAGLIYAFCPFAISFTAYHPLSAALFVAMPYLFCPAAIFRNRNPKQNTASFIAELLLFALPFAITALSFHLMSLECAGPFFPLSINLKLSLENLHPIAFPLSASPHQFALSLYHLPLAAIIIGLFAKFRNFELILASAVALAFAFSKSIISTSPVIWTSIPMLLLAITAANGLNSLRNLPKKKIYIAAAPITAMIILSAAALLTTPNTNTYSAAIFAASAAILAILFTAEKFSKKSAHIITIIIYALTCIDIMSGAIILLDKIK